MVNRKVLFLSDDSVLRHQVGEFLNGFGVDVLTPTNYDDAVITLRLERPDLVVVEGMFDGIGAVVLTPLLREQQFSGMVVQYAWLLPVEGLNEALLQRVAAVQRAFRIPKQMGFTNQILRLAKA